ncbi:hypothetical protein [Luteimonas sp. R10]|uniref:hypothetical protein n=1 Tax=Luteimonas sp. R10 TaxID=3108176 RepID=UPI00308D8172|nr:hypothetical protein U3649_17050 [Luteimonas sp. R10]
MSAEDTPILPFYDGAYDRGLTEQLGREPYVVVDPDLIVVRQRVHMLLQIGDDIDVADGLRAARVVRKVEIYLVAKATIVICPRIEGALPHA